MSRAIRFLSMCLTLAAAAAASAEPEHGSPSEVRVVDEDGMPVAHVAVYVESEGPRTPRTGPRPQAVMDQRKHMFVPHILVVETGTDVDFPNNDDVSHHVYSFSPTKKFELPLYKGKKYPPERFDQAGLVTLGCNIHDNMLGYILVVDTAHFALTDASGAAEIDGLPPGRHRLSVWTPRLRSAHLPAPIEVEVVRGESAEIKVEFAHKLYPPHEHGDSSLSWENY
jgi:plastocyanin